MRLKVRRLGFPEAIVDIDDQATVNDLKNKIEADLSIPNRQQRLLFHGRVLQDEQSLRGYEINNENVIHLVSQPNESTSQTNATTNANRSHNSSSIPNIRVSNLPGGGAAIMTSLSITEGDQLPNIGSIMGSVEGILHQVLGASQSPSSQIGPSSDFARTARSRSLSSYNQEVNAEIGELQKIIESGLASLNISSQSENVTLLNLSNTITALSQLVSLDPDGTMALICLRRLYEMLPRVMIMFEQRALRVRLGESAPDSFLHPPATNPNSSSTPISQTPLKLIIDFLNRLPEDYSIIRGSSSVHFSHLKVKQIKDLLLKRQHSQAIPILQVALVSWMESFALGRLEAHVVKHLAERSVAEIFVGLPSETQIRLSSSIATVLLAAVEKIPSEFYSAIKHEVDSLSKNQSLMRDTIHHITSLIFNAIQPALDQTILEGLGIHESDDRKRAGNSASSQESIAKIHKKN